MTLEMVGLFLLGDLFRMQGEFLKLSSLPRSAWCEAARPAVQLHHRRSLSAPV